MPTWKLIFSYKCSACDHLVKSPITGEMLIPKYYIGSDCVGYRCWCGRTINQGELIQCSIKEE
jgi:hypothetical protein